MNGYISKIFSEKSATDTRYQHTPKLTWCSDDCAVCPKCITPIYIGTDVFIEPNTMLIAGKKHRISNAMFRVLCAFHDNQGKVLSRDFLLFYGWGEKNTVKNNVTVAISELRGLLSNKSDLQILTIHGKGYGMSRVAKGLNHNDNN